MSAPGERSYPVRIGHISEIDCFVTDEAPPERPTTVPAKFVKLETEEARRQAEPIIAISGFGWQHLVENPEDIAELWGAAASFGAPEPDVPLLSWSPDRFSVVSGRRANDAD